MVTRHRPVHNFRAAKFIERRVDGVSNESYSTRTMTTPDEYRAVRERAGLLDEPAWGVIEVRGTDRVAFLHNLLTQDIKSLQAGSAAEAALVTPAAKMLATPIVLAEADAHWLLTPRPQVETVLKTLDRYLITEDVTLADQRDNQTVLAIQGPRSQALLDEAGGAMRRAAYSVTGEPGALVMVPVERAAALRTQLRQHGAMPIGWETMNVLRIEAGIPWFGLDIDENTLLPETGLEGRLVSYTKGCYVGQEIIARVQTYGNVSRKLMGLLIEGHDVPQPKDAILSSGEPVGHITSACFSPALQQPIALGYVKRPFYEAGIAVTVVHVDHAIPATLAKRPFVGGAARTA